MSQQGEPLNDLSSQVPKNVKTLEIRSKNMQLKQIIIKCPNLYQTYIDKTMEQAEDRARQQSQGNKQIIVIIGVYLVFTMFSHLTTESVPFNRNIFAFVNDPQNIVLPSEFLMTVFNTEGYVGDWKLGLNPGKKLGALSRGTGKSIVKFHKFQDNGKALYAFQFQLNNGRYIDDGDVIIRLEIPVDRLNSTRTVSSFDVAFNETTSNGTQDKLKAYYQQTKIFKHIEDGIINLTTFKLSIPMKTPTNPQQTPFITIGSDELFSFETKILQEESRILSTIFFAGILFLISYMQFSSVIEMLKAIFEGRESAETFSVLTILTATMWDAVVCVLAFIQAFGNQESLILFIIPAFLLCLLFTNLELRVLLLIFQSNSETRSIRDVIFKFNLITYGSLLLMYPLIKFTNLNPIIFLAISLLFLPQIYHNAIQGRRPNISSGYYTKFLTFRFLLILYLKCFPGNIFDLQPNYLLSFSIIALVAFQIFLLWVQKVYGPKKVVPNFLLPPVYNYECFIESNVEEGCDADCSICLTLLSNEPEENNNADVPCRIMRGPCGHRFHGGCLSQWMKVKMECPQCRSKLPPFQ